MGYFSAGIAHRSTALPTHGTTPRRKCPGIALRPEEEEEEVEVEEEGPASAWRTTSEQVTPMAPGCWDIGARAPRPPLGETPPAPEGAVSKESAEFPCGALPLPINFSPGEEMIRVSFNRTLISWAPHRSTPGTGISSGVGKGTRDLSGKHLSYLCQHTWGEQR